MRFAKKVTITMRLNTDNDFGIRDEFLDKLSVQADGETLYADVSFTCDSPKAIYGNAVYAAKNYLEWLSVSWNVSATHNYLLKDLYELCEDLITCLTHSDDEFEAADDRGDDGFPENVSRYGDNIFRNYMYGNYDGSVIEVRLEEYPEAPREERLRTIVKSYGRIDLVCGWDSHPGRIAIYTRLSSTLLLDGVEIPYNIVLRRKKDNSIVDDTNKLRDANASGDEIIAEVFVSLVSGEFTKMATFRLLSTWPTPCTRAFIYNPERRDIGFINIEIEELDTP